MQEEIDLDSIDISKWNIRKDLTAGTEDASIEDLAENIREKGLLHPIIVRKSPSGRYELIAGQRRYLACKKLGMRKIRANIRDVDDIEAVEISLAEGLHQAKVNPIDKAKAFKILIDHYKDPSEVGKKIGASATTVKKYLSLLDLPEEIQAKVSTLEGPAKVEALSLMARTFKDKEDMIEAYEQISGFKQPIQLEILKRSEGEISRIPELVAEAQEGAFDTHICRGIHECIYIPDELRGAVEDAIKKHEVESLKTAIKKLKK